MITWCASLHFSVFSMDRSFRLHRLRHRYRMYTAFRRCLPSFRPVSRKYNCPGHHKNRWCCRRYCHCFHYFHCCHYFRCCRYYFRCCRYYFRCCRYYFRCCYMDNNCRNYRLHHTDQRCKQCRFHLPSFRCCFYKLWSDFPDCHRNCWSE